MIIRIWGWVGKSTHLSFCLPPTTSLTAPRHPRTAVSVATATALACAEMFLGDGHPINGPSCTKERPIPSSDREQPQPSVSVRVLGALAICHHQFSEWELGSTSHFNFKYFPCVSSHYFLCCQNFLRTALQRSTVEIFNALYMREPARCSQTPCFKVSWKLAALKEQAKESLTWESKRKLMYGSPPPSFVPNALWDEASEGTQLSGLRSLLLLLTLISTF